LRTRAPGKRLVGRRRRAPRLLRHRNLAGTARLGLRPGRRAGKLDAERLVRMSRMRPTMPGAPTWRTVSGPAPMPVRLQARTRGQAHACATPAVVIPSAARDLLRQQSDKIPRCARVDNE